MESDVRRISGNIFVNSRFQRGTITFTDGIVEFSRRIANDGLTGTVIPTLVNAHTHIGDFFIKEVPEGGIPAIVGPGGFKMKALQSVSDNIIVAAMRRAQKIMRKTGTSAFLDFRETGLHGLDLLEKSRIMGLKQIPLGRPSRDLLELQDILGRSFGLGYSSISDVDIEKLKSARTHARRNGKIFSIHYSENVHEDLSTLIDLKPDLLVHCLETSDSEIQMIKDMNIPVVITPRSNVFYGKRPDYSRFLRAGITVLLGTDNGMVVPPDMLQEMYFLYNYQRGLGYLDPGIIIDMATDRPRVFLEKHKIQVPRSYIFFQNEELTEFEIVTRSSYFRHRIIETGNNS
jgi:cytosine/adenosine deaminase-related metal-dependent hydrolase